MEKRNKKYWKIYEEWLVNWKTIYKDGAKLYKGVFIHYNKNMKIWEGKIFISSYHYIINTYNKNMDGRGRI